MIWKCIRRGYHESADGTLYVSRTRDGWEYGTIENGVLYRIDEATGRPIARAKVLAERGEKAC